jgi:hypothetical protein
MDQGSRKRVCESREALGARKGIDVIPNGSVIRMKLNAEMLFTRFRVFSLSSEREAVSVPVHLPA